MSSHQQCQNKTKINNDIKIQTQTHFTPNMNSPLFIYIKTLTNLLQPQQFKHSEQARTQTVSVRTQLNRQTGGMLLIQIDQLKVISSIVARTQRTHIGLPH